MQKSFLIALVAAAVGALVIFQFLPTLPAYLAFILGAILAVGVIAVVPASGTPSGTTETEYKGPTMTLYVGNLPYRVHEGEVKALFAEYGPVNSVRLVRDRKTGRRKGFGFVEMAESGAQKAMTKLNDYTFQERTLKVREAKNQDNESEKSDD
ncbi:MULTISPECIES: RNA recognition motif domain-containing protein [Shewanella]|jgi:RNA recognition motif-containing protein|uniref:RNA-binding protein n=2 Tax=Shewanella TaxID=22 RepID=A0AAJ1BJH5_9GAMM|nr:MULTISPECIES: RNA-binding protein [Shewanella]AZQ12935.1 RNA recognition motif (aka RRM, RBD, or RNP domain) [Shewanella khirikhana]MCH4295958.1 RNA-binding protein [Shewanella zhuhaiensis]